MQPSPYWGQELYWTSKANNHNGMFDRKGRVWFAAAVRGPGNPAFCRKGSDHPSAKVFPIERTSRHLTVLDPKTMKYTFVDTCFGTHHLQFDANDVLWTSGGGQVVGWLDTTVFDRTGDAARAQGWTPFVLDTNGNGRRDAVRRAGPAGRSGEGQAGLGRLLRRDAESGRRVGLGLDAGLPGGGRPRDAGRQSLGDGAHRDLQRAAAGLRHSRRRHRQAGRRVGVARERPPGELRPSEVQGPAQRSQGDRRPLPRGVDVPSVSGPRLQGHRREQRGVELLHLGRSAQHVRPRRRRADVHREPPTTAWSR